MSKFRFILSVFLFFGIFTNIQASELQRLCGFQIPSYAPSPTCNEESGVVYFGGPNCDNQIYISLYFANLTGYNNLPISGISYSLPTTVPDLYVQLDIDNNGYYEVNIGPINGFVYNGTSLAGTAAQGIHYIFEHEINITPYFNDFDPCPDNNDKIVHSRIMQSGQGGFQLFDPIPFGTSSDIVSCEVFHETCLLCLDRQGNPIAPNCYPNSSIPEYDFSICIDCDTDCSVNRGVLLDNQIEVTKFVPVISPNPFQDEVTVEFEIQKENAPTEIAIYDWTGALILKKSISSEIGIRKESINMKDLPKGVYYLNLISNETRTTSKIVKL